MTGSNTSNADAVGVYLLVTFLGYLSLFILLFPEVENDVWKANAFFTSPRANLTIMVLLAGALGSYVHLGSSFIGYVGNRTFTNSWAWWYIFKPFTGMSIALIFFLLFQAGIIPTNGGGKVSDLYLNLAAAALVGLFNDKSMIKLEEIFNVIFKPDDKRGDKIDDTTMVVESTLPKEFTRGFAGPVTIVGKRFPSDVEVFINGAKQSTKRVSDTEIEVKAVSLPVDPALKTVEIKLKSASTNQESKPFDVKLV